MRFDPTVLVPVTLATSLTGALVLIATLSAPAYAAVEEASWPAGAATGATVEAPVPAAAGRDAGVQNSGRDGPAAPGRR